jgi:hypothetical protein
MRFWTNGPVMVSMAQDSGGPTGGQRRAEMLWNSETMHKKDGYQLAIPDGRFNEKMRKE